VKISELPPLRVVGAHEKHPILDWPAVSSCADVTVDTHTGTVTVDRIIRRSRLSVSSRDYDGAKAQIEGAAVQGIGAATKRNGATFRGDGSVVERGFLTHLIPHLRGHFHPWTSAFFLGRTPDGRLRPGPKGLGGSLHHRNPRGHRQTRSPRPPEHDPVPYRSPRNGLTRAIEASSRASAQHRRAP